MFQQNPKGNLLINAGSIGDNLLDQRFASTSAAKIDETLHANSEYLWDRWKFVYTSSVSEAFEAWREVHTLGQATVPGNPYQYFVLDWTAGTAGTENYLTQRIENVSIVHNKKVGLSLWCRCPNGATTIGFDFLQNFGTGGSPSSDVTIATQNVSVGTSWQRVQLQFTIPSVAGKTLGTDGIHTSYLGFRIKFPLNTAYRFEFGQARIKEGKPEEFLLAGGNAAGEIALAQRYFEKSYNLDSALGLVTDVGANGTLGASSAGTAAAPTSYFQCKKRTTPSIIVYNPNSGATGSGYDGAASPAFTPDFIGQNSWSANITGITANNRLRWHWAADAEL